MDYNKLCMGCMKEMAHPAAFCSNCGYKTGTINSSRGLQPRTILNGKYLIGKILGEGGFGITYIAFDLVLNCRVAIKEYFPSELVTRDTSTGIQTSLTVLTNAKENQYRAGIERFVREAQNLARFNQLDGIVSVKEFFYENNTAYMVMEYIEGVTLSKYLTASGNRLPYNQVLTMMTPVMNSLKNVHAGNIVHRDISPDNIMVANNGAVKLIDFGAARIVDNTDQKSLTVILKHGYAPEEQYQTHGNQGPWTDIYALSATMYRMITGIVPQEATDRILNGDKVVPVNKLVPEVPKNVSDAIMHGLSIKASDRPKSVTEFKTELQKGRKKALPFVIIGIASGATVLLAGVVALILALFVFKKPKYTPVYEEKPVKTEIKSEEDNSEISSDVPEIKELTEEEKLALWKEYQDKILNTLDISYVIPQGEYYDIGFDENGLYGCFDDFDMDGDYELFWELIYGLYGTEAGGYNYFFADENGVWMLDDNEFFTSIDSNSELVKNYKNNYEKNKAEYENYFIYADKLEAMQLGKQKICFYHNEYGYYGSSCFTVWEQAPQYYQGGISVKEDILFGGKDDKFHYYTRMGEGVLCGSTQVFYSPYYLDGQFGELESCLISPEQYSDIPDLVNQINNQAEYVKKSNIENYFFVENSPYGDADRYHIDDISIDSVLYNEAGYFVLNYKCSCTFEQIHSQFDNNWTPGKPYHADMIGNQYGEVVYTGNSVNISKDPIEGLYAYVILKYDNNTYTFVDSNSGYIGTSITDNVLATSKCPWVE